MGLGRTRQVLTRDAVSIAVDFEGVAGERVEDSLRLSPSSKGDTVALSHALGQICRRRRHRLESGWRRRKLR